MNSSTSAVLENLKVFGPATAPFYQYWQDITTIYGLRRAARGLAPKRSPVKRKKLTIDLNRIS